MRNDALFYTCSLIEYIGRDKKLRRDEVVDALGEDTVRRIYRYADVLHCEPTPEAFTVRMELPIVVAEKES